MVHETEHRSIDADDPEELKEELREAPVDQIKEEIRGHGITDFTAGTVMKPSEDEAISPFTTTVRGPRLVSVERIHEERSARAKDVDEQQNAPVTTDEEKWLENPNRYDYPGVDTVPETRQGARAETAAAVVKEAGAVDRVEQKGSAKNLQGKFSPKGTDTYGAEEDVVRVQGTANQPERTLAHEIGHAVDYEYGGERGYKLSDELFGLDTPASEGETEELTEEAIGLSKKARGPFGRQRQYRRQYKELTADAVGMAILQPRATKRDAPGIFERVQEAVEEHEGLDIFGREGAEGERLGIF